MFWKKKNKKEQEKSKIEAEIQTMPTIFYGGNDPEIYHHHDEQVIPSKDSKKGSEVGAKRKTPQLSRASSLDPKKKKLVIIVVSIVLFLIATGAASWYYLSDYFSNQSDQIPDQNVVTEPVDTESAAEVPTSTIQQESVTTTLGSVDTTTSTSGIVPPPSLSNEGELQFPAIILANTPDADNDQLTNKEEELFDTDSGGFDSDADGYFDGQEVFNLYNPSDVAPRRLIDSGLVREYVNPLTQYRLYYPFSWQAGSVDTLGNHVLFSNVEGDFVEVRTFTKVPGQSFTDWFANNTTDQKITDLLSFKNRFELDGWKRRDDLVAYFMDQKHVYVIIFHPAQIGPVAYRNVTKMIVQSFRYAGTTNNTLPDQTVIPSATGDTTSSESNTSQTSTSTDAATGENSGATTASDEILSDNLSNGI